VTDAAAAFLGPAFVAGAALERLRDAGRGGIGTHPQVRGLLRRLVLRLVASGGRGVAAGEDGYGVISSAVKVVTMQRAMILALRSSRAAAA
jgi:hypothetical protein